MKAFFTALFLFFSISLIAQKKPLEQKDIDSILNFKIDTISNNSKKIAALLKITGEYRYTKDTKKFIEKALEYSKKSNNKEDLATSYYILGNFYYYNSSLDSSLFYLDKSLQLFSATENNLLKASVTSTKGGVFQRKGDVSNAIDLFLKAKLLINKVDTLKITKQEVGKIKGQDLVINNSLANLYNQMDDFETALLYYDRAYESSVKLGSKINGGVILSNKGDLLLNIDRNLEALKILQQSKDLKTEGNAPLRLIAGSDLNIGIAYYKMEDYDKALESLNEAILSYESIDHETGLVYTYTYRGVLYNSLKEFELAKKDCEIAKKLAVQSEDLEYQSKACECLYETYKGLGKFDKSLQNYELYLKAKDSIFNKKNIKKLTQLQMQYEFDKQQELQIIEIEKKDQQRKFYLFLSLAGLIIAALLGFFYFKNRKKNILLAKQKKMLEITVDEKNVLLKETHHRVKNSFQIVSSLLYLQSENITDQEAQLAIKEAQNRVRSMVLIHQKLYSKDQLVGIDTEEYFTDLVNDIIESHQFKNNPLSYQLDVDSMILNIETVTPLGLILNEMIVNVLKHAFETIDETSKMNISFKKEGDSLLLKVKDNGKGLNGEVNDTSFGIKLIKALARKLKANLTVENVSEGGTIASLEVKRFEVL